MRESRIKVRIKAGLRSEWRVIPTYTYDRRSQQATLLFFVGALPLASDRCAHPGSLLSRHRVCEMSKIEMRGDLIALNPTSISEIFPKSSSPPYSYQGPTHMATRFGTSRIVP